MQLLAENLRRRSEELGLTGAEVARAANISERRYGNYVAGTRMPDFDTFVRLARVLQTSPNELLGFDERKPSSEHEKLKQQVAKTLDRLGTEHLHVVLVQVRALAKSFGVEPSQ
jgi:transcriptional regulator with XRE-family HTH domain